MKKFSVTLSGESMEEVYAAAAELAAGIGPVKSLIMDKAQKEKAPTKEKPEAEKTSVDDDEPEIATQNRWIQLVDGTMVAIKKGEELPAPEDRGKNVTKKEYQAWEQAQLSGKNDDKEDGFEDEDDDFEDDNWTTSDVKVIDFPTFKQVVKLFGDKDVDRAKKLMKKHSKGNSASIGQFEDDVEGRAAIDAELKERWKNYEKAVAKVTGE